LQSLRIIEFWGECDGVVLTIYTMPGNIPGINKRLMGPGLTGSADHAKDAP
jgi:hypothetical protein